MTALKIDSVLSKSSKFMGVNLDSSFYYAREGLRLSADSQYNKGLQKAYHLIGTNFLYTASSDSALFYLNKAVYYAKINKNKTAEADAYNNIGYMFDTMDDLDSAIIYYKKAVNNYREVNDSSGIAAYYLNMSIIHGRLNDFKTSLEFLIQAHDISVKIKDTSSIGIAKLNIAGKYIDAKKFDKAAVYLKDAFKIFHPLQDYESIAFGYSQYGYSYELQKNFTKAIDYYDSAYVYYSFCKNNYQRAVTLIAEAYIYIEEKNYDECGNLLKKAQEYKSLLPGNKAQINFLLGKLEYLKYNYSKSKQYLQKALSFKLPPDELELPRNAYDLLYKIERKKNNLPKALDFFEKYAKFRDSLKIINAKSEAYNYEKVRKLKIKEKELENLQREKKIKQLELDNQRLVKNYFIGSFIFLLVVFFFGAYQFRKIHKLNQSLKRFNDQKEKFLRIISHDIKNSLGAVLNFSELIMTNIDDLSKEEIIVSTKEINRAATSTNNLLSNLLEWSLTLNNEKEFVRDRIDLKELIDEGVSANVSARLIKKIKCSVDVPKGIIVAADRNSIISVIRNLCTNAIKFSYENSTINLYVKKIDGFAEVTIEDEGVGINEDDLKNIFSQGTRKSTRGTMNEKGTGLGLSLVETFVKNNGGEIKVESEPGKGSKFIFTVPLA
ncbi:MAG: tetratricopeptide repeat protein [Chlorobi bacterium]|nr:tetratricopeptide repeat protein [Chlorobiota bacterium]